MQAFISCTLEKQDQRCKAEDMYKSRVFKASLELARKRKCSPIYILSAKHHLLKLDDVISPYGEYLGNFSEDKKKEWADKVIKEMKDAHIDFNAKTLFFAGEDYIKHLRDLFPNHEEIFKGKRFGEIYHYLSTKLNESVSLSDFFKQSLAK